MFRLQANVTKIFFLKIQGLYQHLPPYFFQRCIVSDVFAAHAGHFGDALGSHTRLRSHLIRNDYTKKKKRIEH